MSGTTKASRASPAQSPRATVRRKQKPQAISIDLAEDALRALMVEQSRDGEDYITVYRGSGAELIAAGVPEAAFPLAGAARRFRVQTVHACSTGGREILEGAMNAVDEGFELEIGWGPVMPYLQCSHPAVPELARMLLISVSSWLGDSEYVDGHVVHDLWHTFDRLAKDPRATGYRPAPGSPRLRISTEFREQLAQLAHELCQFVHRECEVFAEAPVAREPRQRLSLVVDNSRKNASD